MAGTRKTVEDGNDLQAIDQALRAARDETTRPSLVLVRTHIGYGSPDKQDTFEAHGSPLGEEEVKRTKQRLGWPAEPTFFLYLSRLWLVFASPLVKEKIRGGMEPEDSPLMRKNFLTWRESSKK